MPVSVTNSISIPEAEFVFQFTRSGGPGGQNVNKVSTRVELLFNVTNSPSLSEGDKKRLLSKLKGRIDADGTLRVASQQSRSQWKNRQDVVEKFANLLRTALIVRKKRKPTKPTFTSKQKRINRKKILSSKKKMRGKVKPSEH